jgi:hypothetical protein
MDQLLDAILCGLQAYVIQLDAHQDFITTPPSDALLALQLDV